MTTLTQRDYKTALDIQSACNLSGIVFEFARVMHRICDDTRDQGTDAKNHHAICRMYAEQIAYLSGGGSCTDSDSYGKAYDTCSEIARFGLPEEVKL